LLPLLFLAGLLRLSLLLLLVWLLQRSVLVRWELGLRRPLEEAGNAALVLVWVGFDWAWAGMDLLATRQKRSLSLIPVLVNGRWERNDHDHDGAFRIDSWITTREICFRVVLARRRLRVPAAALPRHNPKHSPSEEL
jgi:hypothetical protein